MRIFVFGNPDLAFDSLPLRILPALKRRFTNIEFEHKDPSEEFEIPEKLVVVDTVEGIDSVTLFDNLKHFTNHPHVSLHDFDLWSQLKYLQKLGKLRSIKIIGIPPTMDEKTALQAVTESITKLESNR